MIRVTLLLIATLVASCSGITEGELTVATSDVEAGWWRILVVTEPPRPEDPPEGATRVWRFPSDILFETGSSRIAPEAVPLLRDFAAGISADRVAIVIMGHTDDVGTAASNRTLAVDRATSLRDVLVDRLGVSVEQISVDGRGEDCPIETNETPAGRAKNRRVEVFEPGNEPPCAAVS